MKAGDRKINISEEQYQEIVREEFVSMVKEQYGTAALEEGFFDKLKGGGKKIMKSYINVFKAYAEVVEDLFGVEPDDPKMDKVGEEVPEPEEVAQDLAAGDTEEAADAMDDMEANLAAIKQRAADNPEAAKKGDALISQVRQQSSEMDDGGGEPTEDSPALLDLLDGIADDWEKIQKSTKDASLKKAMGYIEKIALAEIQRQQGRRKLNKIREKRKNG